jgi:hypothetical protein
MNSTKYPLHCIVYGSLTSRQVHNLHTVVQALVGKILGTYVTGVEIVKYTAGDNHFIPYTTNGLVMLTEHDRLQFFNFAIPAHYSLVEKDLYGMQEILQANLYLGCHAYKNMLVADSRHLDLLARREVVRRQVLANDYRSAARRASDCIVPTSALLEEFCWIWNIQTTSNTANTSTVRNLTALPSIEYKPVEVINTTVPRRQLRNHSKVEASPSKFHFAPMTTETFTVWLSITLEMLEQNKPPVFTLTHQEDPMLLQQQLNQSYEIVRQFNPLLRNCRARVDDKTVSLQVWSPVDLLAILTQQQFAPCAVPDKVITPSGSSGYVLGNAIYTGLPDILNSWAQYMLVYQSYASTLLYT